MFFRQMGDFYLNIYILDKDSPTPRRLVLVHVQPNEHITELFLPESDDDRAGMIVCAWDFRRRITKTDEYISYEQALRYIKEALEFSRSFLGISKRPITDFEQTVGSWYFEHVADKLAEERLRYVCAKRIQIKWRECVSNPYHPICERRLRREYNELVT